MKLKLLYIYGLSLLILGFAAANPLPASAQLKTDGIKPYPEIVPTTAKSSVGFFTVHKVAERYLFELPDSVFNRDLFTVNRIIRSPADYRFVFLNAAMCNYGGDWMGQNMFHFEKIPGNKVALKAISYTERSGDSTQNGVSRALLKNNMQPIYALFPIKAVNTTKNTVVIDMTDYLGTENGIFGYNPTFKPIIINGPVAADRSYIKEILAYPTNVEIKNVRTMSMASPGGTQTFTFEFNNSIILLPKEPMKTRSYDPRVGYLALVWNDYKDFDDNPKGIKDTHHIWKWRLEPKDEDRARYDRGELVEPKKPIVFYIDPATPKKWVPYLIQGINDWQVALEGAGFKNAIIGKEVSLNDSTFNIDDARHNVVVYKASGRANATGNTIQDPRTGENMESHVDWYHSVMEILYKWYLIQAGAIDPRARTPHLDDELMGELIRFVSSHEIGHTLGLRHNWGASATTPVEKLRDKAWVEAHGHTPSIMDYARFNYVAQPEDHISEKGIFPRIGDYDKWAIEWGYRVLPENKTVEQEKQILNQWITDKLKTGEQYKFGIERVNDVPTSMLDPRNQNEDLGNDAILASNYGIKNLKRILPNLISWTIKPGDSYVKAGEMYEEVVAQYKRYMFHVAMSFGGLMTDPKTSEQPGVVYTAISKEKQKKSMVFLQKELFSTPYWLMDKKMYSLAAVNFNSVEAIQKDMIRAMLDIKQIEQMRAMELFSGILAYPVSEMLYDLKQGIFSELPVHQAISLNRRNLQKSYVLNLITLYKTGLSTNIDATSTVKVHAKELTADLKRAISTAADKGSKAHLSDLYDKLYAVLYQPLAIAKQNVSK
ncbi:zinc-dependent metalloprotease [Pedobacter hiemivivus]|uniref:DUF5117 domain-containing protein n=1 Tax=Pedobacter hiemivivus TaxID=2530454 RepID=A0A4R0NJ77_9SPHI|nr:zinc-dependent metalloprotease [Pedobacter hiemivivus]TCC99462.1 DUF5117 domain-containing protein [Pedobacter hiemivivus]